ncbi:hypothetical protein KCP73_07430 [Salmonella enterica subsp. enterica]|nr:hypothetical protein KCP73_07430 [Salmonella enterica subsp. enterica]
MANRTRLSGSVGAKPSAKVLVRIRWLSTCTGAFHCQTWLRCRYHLQHNNGYGFGLPARRHVRSAEGTVAATQRPYASVDEVTTPSPDRWKRVRRFDYSARRRVNKCKI